MSRIGKLPISVPDKVIITINNNNIIIKGPKGELSYNFDNCIEVIKQENKLIVNLKSVEFKNLWGLTRTLIANMIEGVTNGYQKKLLVFGVGYNAKLQGNKLVLNIGYSHAVNFELPKCVTASLEKDVKNNDIIVLNSIDKQKLGEIAAKLKYLKKLNIYKGKGIRYLNEVIKLKAGKVGGK